MTVKVVINTLDNLPLLQEQIPILRADPFVDGIVVVNNGSKDGTKGWLAQQSGLTVINRENKGAGPGRNAGIDAAGECDYFLFLDGGIRPLRGGTEKMLEYLDRHPEADVLGVEIPDFEVDYTRAWRRWPNYIEDQDAYVNTRLSHTAYALTRHKAFDGLRFNGEGPFGEPGWGADDDEMMCRWRDAGIAVHVVSCRCNRGEECTGVHPYRHASGSFRRLFLETGIWPNQFGSVYERRVVWLQQNYPQYEQGTAWREPWLTVVVDAIDPSGIIETVKTVKLAHDLLRERRFAPPYDHAWNPYSVIVWNSEPSSRFSKWVEVCALRQHHGDTVIQDGAIIRRDEINEDLWTGDFRVWCGDNWQEAVRQGAAYYAIVKGRGGLRHIFETYNALYPPQPDCSSPPSIKRQEMLDGN